MKLSLKLKPSLVGKYFENKCDRSLVYSAISDDNGYKALNWPLSQGFKENAAARAGIEWEKILLDKLEEDDSCVVINLKCNEDGDPVAQTLEALRSLNERKKTVYLYQSCLRASESAKRDLLSPLSISFI